MKSSEKKFHLDAWSISDNINLCKKISDFLREIGCFSHGAMSEIVVSVSIIHDGNER